MEQQAIGDGLTARLRMVFAHPELELDGELEPLSGGFVNPIYGLRLSHAPPSLDRDLVLRIDGRPPGGEGRFAREFATQQFVFDAGFPAAEPLLFEPDPVAIGAPFMLMARVAGEPLIDRLLPPGRPTIRALSSWGAAMAQLHQVPVDGFPGDHDRVSTYRMELEQASEERYPQLRRVVGWLSRQRPTVGSSAVCHLDMQPFNLLTDEDGAVTGVVDWENTGLADRHLDLADFSIVMTQAPFDGPVPAWVMAPVRRVLVARVFRAYRRHLPIDREQVAYYRVLAAARRLGGALEDRPSEPGGEPTGFTSPAYIDALTRVIDAAVAADRPR